MGLEIAGPFRRVYAYVVDIGLLLMLKFTIDSASGSFGFALDRRSIIEVAIFLAYFTIPTGIFGRTIGKWVAGITVVGEDGKTPGVAVAIPREMVGRFVATITFALGLLWVFFDSNRQGWHDKMAGTYVVIVPNTGLLARFFTVEREKAPAPPRQRTGRPANRRKRRTNRR